MLDIVVYPDPVLNRVAEPVPADRGGLRELAEDMLGAMKEAHGVGLAAPQVGISLRLFVASATGEFDDSLICINPEIEPFGGIVEMEEGCLSVPDVRAMIRRPEKVRMRWTDLDGHLHASEFDELLARIIQHEYDHLEGVLFMERMTPTDRLRIRADLESLEEQYLPR